MDKQTKEISKNDKIKFGFQTQAEKDFPYMVLLETTTICNLKCIHCPYRFYSKEPWYEFKHIDWKLLTKVTDEVGAHHGYLRFSCIGEPLLYPRFAESVDYAEKAGVDILSFNTNGLILDGERLDAVVKKRKMNVIVEVSLDAFSKETYERIRVGSDYDRVMANIEAFLKKRKENGSNAKLMVSIIDQPEVAHEYQQFIDYWEKKADRVIRRKYVSVKDALDKSKEKFEKVNRWPCLLLWKRFNVSVDGLVHFCIDDWKKESKLPYNINTTTIKEVWHSPEYEKLRQQHLSGKYGEAFPCNRCREWQVVEWGYDYQYAVNALLGRKQGA